MQSPYSAGQSASADAANSPTDGEARRVRGRGDRRIDGAMRRILDHTGVECRDIADRFEFPFFHLSFRTVVPPGVPVEIFVDGGPAKYREVYEAHLGYCNDAILKRAFNALVPFQLRDAIDPADAEAAGAFRQCAKFGILDGFAIPLHGPRVSHGMLCLMGSAPLPKSTHLREELFRQAHWLALFMFERTIAEIAEEHERNARKQLTSRQRTALSLAGTGKVLTEIAEKLLIHPSTARYLVVRAAEKLGVETREEAIVRMAALGDFQEDLFPRTLREAALYYAFPPK